MSYHITITPDMTPRDLLTRLEAAMGEAAMDLPFDDISVYNAEDEDPESAVELVIKWQPAAELQIVTYDRYKEECKQEGFPDTARHVDLTKEK